MKRWPRKWEVAACITRPEVGMKLSSVVVHNLIPAKFTFSDLIRLNLRRPVGRDQESVGFPCPLRLWSGGRWPSCHKNLQVRKNGTKSWSSVAKKNKLNIYRTYEVLKISTDYALLVSFKGMIQFKRMRTRDPLLCPDSTRLTSVPEMMLSHAKELWGWMDGDSDGFLEVGISDW